MSLFWNNRIPTLSILVIEKVLFFKKMKDFMLHHKRWWTSKISFEIPDVFPVNYFTVIVDN